MRVTSAPAADQATLDSLVAAEHPCCLMCGGANRFGMGLRFMVQADGSVLATFPCQPFLQSYPETLHGGVIAALLDAAMTNALFSIGVVAVTAELTVRFLAPVSLGQPARVRAAIESARAHPLYHLSAELRQGDRQVARANAKFLVKGCV
jgi:uncharacterized protein (TIGR00369 family)